MGEIADLENRLSAALDRIAKGVDGIGAPAATPIAIENSDQTAEIQALQQALEAERATNAQLEERVRALTASQSLTGNGSASHLAEIDTLKAVHAEEIAAVRQDAVEEREAWEGLSNRLVRMRRSNKLMRSNAVALRQAALEKVVDAEVINQSLQTELEALKSAYDLERAEADVIIKTLEPLLDEADVEEMEGNA